MRKLSFSITVLIFLLWGTLGAAESPTQDNPSSSAGFQDAVSYQESQRQLMKKFDEDKEMLNYKLGKELAKLGDSAEDEQKRRLLIQDNQQQLDALRDKFQQSLRELQREERKVRYGREDLERPIFLYDEDTLKYYRNQESRQRLEQGRESAGNQTEPQPSYRNQPVNPGYSLPQQNVQLQAAPTQQPTAADVWLLDKLSNQAAAEKAQLPPAGALYQPMSQTIKSISQDPHRVSPNSTEYLQNKAR